MTKTICVLSGKGGVGKTVIAENIASALHLLGRDVILIDADVESAHLSLKLNLAMSENNIQKILKSECDILDSVYLHSSGLKIVPASVSEELSISEKDFDSRLSSALNKLSGKTEIIIIEGISGFSAKSIALANISDLTLLVTTPEKISVFDSIKLANWIQKVNNNIWIAVNLKSKSNLGLDTKNIESLLGKPVVLEVPDDPLVKESIEINYPIVFSHPESASATAFKEFAKKIVNGNAT